MRRKLRRIHYRRLHPTVPVFSVVIPFEEILCQLDPGFFPLCPVT